MNYAAIKTHDIANGLGVRVSLFVSGCTRHCEGCFNQEAQDFNYGEKFTKDTLHYLMSLLDMPYISGLSILGGEPFELKNQQEVLNIVKSVKDARPDKDIWVYTGNIFGTSLELKTTTAYKIFKYIDVLIDGPFILDQADISLKFRGSKNQRIIDMPATLSSNEVILIAM